MARELIIYCDESDAAGKFYSDFYGGVLVKSKDLDYVKTAISKKKLALHLDGEVKWQKVTSNYLDKYKELVDLYFALTREGKLKTRIRKIPLRKQILSSVLSIYQTCLRVTLF